MNEQDPPPKPATAPRSVDRTTRTWRLIIAYRGAGFHGYQGQGELRTVQQTLQAALEKLSDGPVKVRGAGRTDAGVHARGQVVSTTFASRITPEKMILACNSQLPEDLAVVRADVMPRGFDARTHAVGKRYVYRVHNAPWPDPFVRATSWHVPKPMNVEAMKAAAALFVGEHDFESFRSAQCDAAHARRYLWRSVVEVEGPEVRYEVRGNAFCRNMVRCLAGTLVDVGRGRFSVDDVGAILAAKDRTRAGITAHAQGLTMEEVYYPDALEHAGIPDDAVFPGFPVQPSDWPPCDEEPPSSAREPGLDEGADDGA